jgi:hypothetical protein
MVVGHDFRSIIAVVLRKATAVDVKISKNALLSGAGIFSSAVSIRNIKRNRNTCLEWFHYGHSGKRRTIGR